MDDADHFVQIRNRFRRRHRVERVLRDRRDPLAFDDEALFAMYRFRRPTLLFLFDLLAPVMMRQTARSNALPVHISVLAALQFFATGVFYATVGRLLDILNPSTVGGCVRDVSKALRVLSRRFLDWDDMERTRTAFRRLCGFPRVIGCVDGTHVEIRRPASAHENDFICRKGYHSINVQATCDDRFRFVDVVARWPGATHDARIWRNSGLRQRLLEGQVDGMLLGDSGYPCEVFLMVPYLTPETPPQHRFNLRLCRGRVLIEQSFGICKRRFPCIAEMMRVEPVPACRIIVSVMVLHNIGIDQGDIIPPPEAGLPALPPAEDVVADDPSGRSMRIALTAEVCV